MDAIVGLFWFFYLLLCPAATLAVLIWFTATCRDASDLALRGIPAVGLLVLVLGPIWTEIGPMPWWGPRASPNLLNRTVGVQYFVWQYAALCAGTFLVFGLVALARRTGKPRSRRA